MVYFQNPSSIVGTLALDARPEEEILDLCGAPGGKTHLLWILMEGRGRLAANEKDRTRFFRMRDNLATLGAGDVNLYMHDGRTIGRKTPGRFDKVLLDAPCSSDSLANLDDPRSLVWFDGKKRTRMAKLQKSLIVSAFDALKPGGSMVYSTCAFSPTENEEVVAHLLASREDAGLIPPTPDPAWSGFMSFVSGRCDREDLSGTVRILPSDLANAFYFAVISKRP